MEVCQKHSGLEARINNVEQDIVEVKDASKDINKKLDSIKTWLIGLTGSFAVSVLLLLINYIILKNGH